MRISVLPVFSIEEEEKKMDIVGLEQEYTSTPTTVTHKLVL